MLPVFPKVEGNDFLAKGSFSASRGKGRCMGVSGLISQKEAENGGLSFGKVRTFITTIKMAAQGQPQGIAPTFVGRGNPLWLPFQEYQTFPRTSTD
ncbi:hypothetical protein ACFSC6_20160 [Rufibacter sediminis]|uniref:Uncharacterized protein n=1 Tax=Rufibacter sediminis TaxID=2762756 RepID=A0ABR6VPF1_9BACT|nr:hypothetical protein [Rufibacter sediminis]MBC3538764.1 hypothetical protein [Rufibacter sediminis]